MPESRGMENRDHHFIPAFDVRSITINGPAGHVMGVTRLRSPRAGNGLTRPHALEDAFMLSVQLQNYQGSIWLNNHDVAFSGQAAGEVMFYDYREEWRADLQSAFDCINFHIPRAMLNAVLESDATATLEAIRYEPGLPQRDPVVLALVQALLPSFETTPVANQLFVDHVGWAISSHVARSYGDLLFRHRTVKGQLAPWQERRAKALIEDQLAEGVSLTRLASECGLSTSHFARAFRASTGMAPYQWLLQRRVERACELLQDRDLTIAEIAAACGFSDQSHLSRAFVRARGEPPATWRRRNVE